MSYNSKIEWTETTWNPITGCTKISAGCKNCYAERISNQLKRYGQPRYRNGFKLTIHKEVIPEPFKWKKSRIIFVNSMSDLFHEDIPDSIIKEIFDVMNKCPQHIFQVLTKRSERLKILSPHLYWTRNIWMGVTIENADFLKRIPDLQKSDAYIKFLSLEPFIGPIKNLPLDNIDWIIVGGESGPKARPMSIEWVRDIRDRCEEEKVSFFFKQWGGIKKHASGRVLDGKIWDEKPTLIRKANCTEV